MTLTSRYDLVGVVLLIAAVFWVGVVKSSPPTIFIAAGFAFVLGRLAASLSRSVIPAVVVLTGAFLAISSGDIASHAPLSGPFGYSNATAAFFVLIAFAALMLAVVAANPIVRLISAGAALASAAVPILGRSMAATILIAVGAIAALPAGSVRRARAVVAGLAILFVAVLFGTILIASRENPGTGVPPWLADPLTERRMTTWGDAWRTMQENPPAGVGIGRFPLFSEAARYDPASPWAHNEFLQFGAEAGVPAFALLSGIFLWGFIRVAVMRTPGRYAVLGAGAIAAAGVHACIDGVLRFWPVPLVAALLAGSATLAAER